MDKDGVTAGTVLICVGNETSRGRVNAWLSSPKKEKSIYRINKKNGTMCNINRFYVDIFDTYTNFPFSNTTSGNKIFYKINALEIKNIADKKKEAGEELAPRLKELSEQLKDEDNPVIIVGKLN